MNLTMAECKRGELIAEHWRKPPDHIAKAIRKLGNLELIFVNGDWCLYSVKLFGAVPSDDLLIYQRKFKQLDGSVVRDIQKSLYENTGGGTWDEEETKRAVKRILQSIIVNQRLSRIKRIQDVCADIKAFNMHYAVRKRRSFSAKGEKKQRIGWVPIVN